VFTCGAMKRDKQFARYICRQKSFSAFINLIIIPMGWCFKLPYCNSIFPEKDVVFFGRLNIAVSPTYTENFLCRRSQLSFHINCAY
jgi:hypothetical protein